MERNNGSDSFKRVVKNQDEKKKDVSFDDIVEEAMKVSKDEEEAMRLVTEIVVNKFVSSVMRKKNQQVEPKRSVSSSQISLELKGKRDDKNLPLVDDSDHTPVGKEEDQQKRRKLKRNNNGNRSINVDDGELKKRRKPKKKLVKRVVPDDMEEEEVIPDEFRREIESLGGGNIKLVLARRLTRTDTAPGQSKLSLPFNQLRYRFIRPDEDEILRQNKEAGTGLKGIDIRLFEPSLRRCDNMRLKWWRMNTQGQGVYALNGEWKHVLKRNKNVLEKGAYVQVWSFRIRTQNGPPGSGVQNDKEGELGFALVVPPSGGDSSGSGGEERSTGSTKTEDSSSGKECGTSTTKPEDIGSNFPDTISDRD